MVDLALVISVVGEMLSARLGQGGRASYSELCEQFGLPPLGRNWTQHPLRRIFAALDAEDARLHRPLRTCCVVNKLTGRPGRGFYKSLARARKFVLDSEAAREKAYQEEVASARETYSKYSPGRRSESSTHAANFATATAAVARADGS